MVVIHVRVSVLGAEFSKNTKCHLREIWMLYSQVWVGDLLSIFGYHYILFHMPVHEIHIAECEISDIPRQNIWVSSAVNRYRMVRVL